MKKQLLNLCLATVILAHPLNGAAQSARANCDAVTQAAVAGRDAANERIKTIEEVIAEQAQTMRSCMELFSDLAARTVVVIGGFDLTPIRDRLMTEACNMIQDGINEAENALATELPQYPEGLNGLIGSTDIYKSSTVRSTTPAQSTPSFWDRLGCTISGNC